MHRIINLLLILLFCLSAIYTPAQTIPDIHPNKRVGNPRMRDNRHFRTEMPYRKDERNVKHEHAKSRHPHKEHIGGHGALRRR